MLEMDRRLMEELENDNANNKKLYQHIRKQPRRKNVTVNTDKKRMGRLFENETRNGRGHR